MLTVAGLVGSVNLMTKVKNFYFAHVWTFVGQSASLPLKKRNDWALIDTQLYVEINFYGGHNKSFLEISHSQQ